MMQRRPTWSSIGSVLPSMHRALGLIPEPAKTGMVVHACDASMGRTGTKTSLYCIVSLRPACATCDPVSKHKQCQRSHDVTQDGLAIRPRGIIHGMPPQID